MPQPSPAPLDAATALAPEAALLVHCARLEMEDERHDAVVRIVNDEPDWRRVLALAERNGVLPLLAHHLHARPGVVLPTDVHAELARRRRETLNASLRLTADLRRVVALLAKAGVESLAYKGPTLAVQAYGDLGLRRFVDLDLLVRPEDAPRALEALARAGFESVYRLTARQDAHFRRVDGDYPLVHGQTGVLLELHCRPSSERFLMPLGVDGLMRRAVPVRLGGDAVRAPEADDLLLILCAHGAKHRWRRLEWTAAVAELLRHGGAFRAGPIGAALETGAEPVADESGPLAEVVLRRADGLHARRTMLLGFHLAHHLLGAPLPNGVVREMEGDRGIAHLAAESVARMFEERPDDGEDGEETAANLLYNLRARDRWTDRARYAWRWLTLPSPEDWRAAPLPDPLFPAYRVTRPLRLLARYAPRALRRP